MAPEKPGKRESDLDETKMTLGEHLEELRRRILYALGGLAAGLVGGLLLAKPTIDLLTASYVRAMQQAGLEPELNLPAMTAGMASFFTVALVVGLVIASPWIFYQLWTFVSAGLYRRERRYVAYAVPSSALLFAGGAAFFLFVVSEPVMRFFVHFNRWMGARQIIMLWDHVIFVTHLMVLFGLAFQTPIVVFLLARMGLVSVKTLRRYRRHVIVAVVIVAAVLTPPDVLSQIAVAVPVLALYELGVLLAYLSERKDKARRKAELPAE